MQRSVKVCQEVPGLTVSLLHVPDLIVCPQLSREVRKMFV